MLWKIFTHLQLRGPIKTFISAEKIINMSFYAVARGRTPGIFMNWPDCEAQVKGFPGARYKKFGSAQQAQEFITTEGGSVAPQRNKPSASSSNFSNTNKRSFSTSSNYHKDNNHIPTKKPRNRKRKSESSDSDNSDDLSAIVTKQMDDIEKRLKSFEKGVDKIIKNSAKVDRKTILIEPQAKSRNSGNRGENFDVDEEGYVQVYTDGACSANGRNGARAGLGVYWGDGHALNLSEPVSGRATNNCGEIQAATRAIKQALSQGVDKLAINTDSKFLINSVTKWMPGWKRKGWKLKSGEPVKNEIDFKDLDSVQNKIQIKWNYVEAHRGIHGNEMADQLAKTGASMYNK